MISRAKRGRKARNGNEISFWGDETILGLAVMVIIHNG